MYIFLRWIIIGTLYGAWVLFEAGPPYASRIAAWFAQVQERLSSIPLGFWLLFGTLCFIYGGRHDEEERRQQETERLLKDIAKHTARLDDIYSALQDLNDKAKHTARLDEIYNELQDLNDKEWRCTAPAADRPWR